MSMNEFSDYAALFEYRRTTCKRRKVYCKLDKPIAEGRRTYDFVCLSYISCALDTGNPETMAFPAVMEGGEYMVANWGDLAAWYDDEPDFERYAKKLGATIVTEEIHA